MRTYKASITIMGLFLCIFAGCDDPGETEPKCIDPNKIDPNAACIEIYQPVCGCDGISYENSCFAEINGVTAWTEGECGD